MKLRLNSRGNIETVDGQMAATIGDSDLHHTTRDQLLQDLVDAWNTKEDSPTLLQRAVDLLRRSRCATTAVLVEECRDQDREWVRERDELFKSLEGSDVHPDHDQV